MAVNMARVINSSSPFASSNISADRWQLIVIFAMPKQFTRVEMTLFN
jgi:hypothetical protein